MSDELDIRPMTLADLPLWERWTEKLHVKEVWFIPGYEPVDYITQKITGNGYDHPFIIELNKQPIGYIVCCDLYAYKTICPNPKGIFINEDLGTFCMDLFIGEEEYLNKGYGTKIVQLFTQMIYDEYKAKKIYIDPSCDNKRAIRCYEKAGFKFFKTAFDGVCECYVMKHESQSSM